MDAPILLTVWVQSYNDLKIVCAVSPVLEGHHYKDPSGHQYENEDTITMICKTTRGGLIEIRVDMLSDRPHNLNCYSL